MTVVLYIACTLDGYIATPDGGVEWLSAVEIEGEDYGYRAFLDSVDALIMGSRTYEQIQSFGEWPYEDKLCWVMSRRVLRQAMPTVHVSHEAVEDLLKRLQNQGLDRVWLVGGSALVNMFERAGCIDEYIISVVPQLLGEGLPLFTPGRPQRTLRLVDSRQYPGGLVQLHYRTETTANK